MYKHVAYVFCRHLDKDPVAAHVFQQCLTLLAPERSPDTFDGHPVYRWSCPSTGLTVSFAQSEEVISYCYERYLPELNRTFAACDFLGVVNWHEGANAPDGILCLHTTGDVPTGIFGAADPVAFTALFRALRVAAAEAGCAYGTLSEATHWSGVARSSPVELISQFAPPVMDIEIGSSPATWSNPTAHTALARALVSFPLHLRPYAPTILSLGGVHFESAFYSPLLANADAYNLSHILPNHWVHPQQYAGPEGVCLLHSAAASIRGGIHAVVFHDNLKGPLKDAARAAATELGVPAFNHKVLRDPQRFAVALPQFSPPFRAS